MSKALQVRTKRTHLVWHVALLLISATFLSLQCTLFQTAVRNHPLTSHRRLLQLVRHPSPSEANDVPFGAAVISHDSAKQISPYDLVEQRRRSASNSSVTLTEPQFASTAKRLMTTVTFAHLPTPPGDIPFAHHRESRILFLLHIHKSAGTNLCLAAHVNGLRVALENNCNVQPDQRCCGGQDSLHAHSNFAKTSTYQLVANEQDMYDTMDVEHYRYVIVLRSSKHRYYSHWNNVRRQYAMTNLSFAAWWKRQPDNWTVRKICGTACQHIPKYHLTPELLVYTLERLEKFEDILFVEQFNETFTRFANQVGWCKMPVPRPSSGRDVHNATVDLRNEKNNRTMTTWDPLMSALDDILYDYAQLLYHQRLHPQVNHASAFQPSVFVTSSSAARRYFQQGAKRKCRTPCCGVTCSAY